MKGRLACVYNNADVMSDYRHQWELGESFCVRFLCVWVVRCGQGVRDTVISDK